MSARRTGRAVSAVLISILLLGALLRLLGLDGGLPHVVGVDEGFEVHRALRLGAGEFDFERDGKGGFFYLLFVEYGLYFLWLLLLGEVGSATDFAKHFVTDLTPFYMIGRITHAAVALVTVHWTYRLGRRMYGESVGLFGAAVVAVSTLHVARSHYIGVDIPMVLLVVVLLELAHSWSDPGQPPRPFLTGALFGLTVMHKISGIAAVAPIAVANWIRHRRGTLLERIADRRVVLLYLTAAVVFVVGNPGFVLNLRSFFGEAFTTLTGIGVEPDSPGAPAGATPNLWLYYLRVLSADLGFALFVLALAGVVLALVRRRPADLLLVATLAAFYLLIAGAQTSHLFYPRYAIPLIPPLGLLAGRLLDRVVRRLPLGGRAADWATAGAALLLLWPAALQSWAWVRAQAAEDTRVVTRSWFESSVESGSAVLLIGNPLVDTAPNLSLPLRNTDANLDELIAGLRETEPTKARMLEWRMEVAPGVKFDLRTVRHFEPSRTLDDYLAEGVRYLVLDEHHFGARRLERDRKHSSEVLESRTRLAEACRTDPRIERVFAIDPLAEGLTGPAIEVFGLRRGVQP